MPWYRREQNIHTSLQKWWQKKSAALKSQRDSQHRRPQNEHQTELELLGIESARRAVLVLASRWRLGGVPDVAWMERRDHDARRLRALGFRYGYGRRQQRRTWRLGGSSSKTSISGDKSCGVARVRKRSQRRSKIRDGVASDHDGEICAVDGHVVRSVCEVTKSATKVEGKNLDEPLQSTHRRQRIRTYKFEPSYTSVRGISR